jgi:hypothetical protein
VEPLLTASEIVEEDQEHLGIMAYAASLGEDSQAVFTT